MFDEIDGKFEVGVTQDAEIIIFVEGVWQAAIRPTDARGIASSLYVAAAESETITATKNN
jgi:hypothetical protein